VNREEVNWLLQTIADGETTERFVSALCERVNFLAGDGRCGTRTRSDKPHGNRFGTTATRHSDQYPATELPVAMA
jgi:hypothetical protein